MDVDINNLRIRLAKNTDRLIKKLNAHITEDNEVIIPVEEIESLVEDVRQSVWVLCCIFDETKNGDFREVWEDVGEITTFNPQPEE